MAAKKVRPDQTRFKIEVLQEDIEKALRNNSQRCVVAQAIARTIPDATRIEIDLQSIRFTRAETGQRLLYLTPNIAAGYVVAFDAGDDMHPFDFWIDRPMRIRRQLRTEAGKQIIKAKRKAAKPRSATSAEVALTEPDAVAQAVKEEWAGSKLSKSDKGGPKRPRTFKTGKRVYGSRILRVNRYLRDAS